MRASLDYVYNEQERGATYGSVLSNRTVVPSRNPSDLRGANEGTSLCTPILEYARSNKKKKSLLPLLMLAGLRKCKLIEATFIN